MVNAQTLAAQRNTDFVKRKALELGFSFCGIAQATQLEREARQLEQWLKEDRNGQMGYMANHFELRIDPRKLVEGARTVVSLGYTYYPENDSLSRGPIKISKYAYGRDYHKVVKKKLLLLMHAIEQEIGQIAGRAFVDSAPVMEKVWAARAGNGWVGKHTNLLNRQQGSFFFLAELIIDLDLVPDAPVKDHCGTCTRCLDACPTGALTRPYEIDASKCISYFTIELKEAIPAGMERQFEGWAFGCDICQDVCPWNRFSVFHQEPQFLPKADLLELHSREWLDVTEEIFAKVFEGSPVKRTGYAGFQRNLDYVRRGQGLAPATDLKFDERPQE